MASQLMELLMLQGWKAGWKNCCHNKYTDNNTPNTDNHKTNVYNLCVFIIFLSRLYIYYIAASTGLAIAAMLGSYSASHLLDKDNTLADYFSPYRKFILPDIIQKCIGKKATFALSNVINMNIP